MLLRADYLRCVLALLAFSFIGACASGPGTLDDSDPEALDDALGVGLRDPIDPFPSIPPDPFQPGDERLSEIGRAHV